MKLQSGKDIQETNEFIAISAETDRIYYDTSREHIIDTGNLNNRRINLKKENFPGFYLIHFLYLYKNLISFFIKILVCIEYKFNCNIR